MKGVSDIYSSQDNFNWYVAWQRDGKEGMIPRNHVMELEENTATTDIAPQAPLSVEAGITDVSDLYDTRTANPTEQGEVKLSNMQVRPTSYKKNKWHWWWFTSVAVWFDPQSEHERVRTVHARYNSKCR